jgi:pentatricopeptide repeat protein
VESKIFNTVLEASGLNGDLDATLKILQMMHQCDIVPSKETFESLSRGFALSGNFDNMQILLTHMRSYHIVPNADIFNKALETFGMEVSTFFRHHVAHELMI